MQIINTPNRKIIDYVSRFCDSKYDTHCFAYTKLGQNLSLYLEKDELC